MDSNLLPIFLKQGRVTTDTRQITPGDIFFALKGERFDGNKYAGDAIEKGAAYTVIDDPTVAVQGDDRFILVKNALTALQELASAYRKRWNFPVLGLTGSNGKTTTKELIVAALKDSFKVHATAGNYNNHIGVPLTLLSIPEDAEIAVVEMGTNQPGDIAQLASIAAPTHALITNVGHAHLEKLISLEGVKVEKGALFDFVKVHNGVGFINLGDHRVEEAGKRIRNRMTFNSELADLQLESLTEGLDQMEVRVKANKWPEAEQFNMQLTGAHNAQNLLAALTVGTHFGLKASQMRPGLESYQSQNNRSQLIQKGRFQIWLDAYNANPDSMKASIQHVCAEVNGEGCLLVLGDMLELGHFSREAHQEMGKFINQFQPERVVGVGPQMHAMVEAVTAPSCWFPEANAAIPHLPELLVDVERILIKGSRGMALERLVEEIPG
ncbi:MAG: UDP-N-acetylmuramoyl-tripeptide--D-alanyl-D-alanine ligase [Bacteroidota bacterium]